MKHIGFVGIDSTDIVLYIARMLSFCGRKVAVMDYTGRHELIRTANVPDVLFGSGSFYKEIFIVSTDAFYDENELRSREYVIHYFGQELEHPQIKGCGEVVFVTDMVVSHAEQLKDVSCAEGTRKRCIIRNMVEAKYKPSYLLGIMGQGIAKGNCCLLQYSENDYRSRCYLCMDANHKAGLRKLSYNMQEVLATLFCGWEQTERKEMQKIFKNA